MRLFPTKFQSKWEAHGHEVGGWNPASSYYLYYCCCSVPEWVKHKAHKTTKKLMNKKSSTSFLHCDFYWTFIHTFWHTLTLLSGSVAKRLELIPLRKNASKRHLFNVFAEIEKAPSGDPEWKFFCHLSIWWIWTPGLNLSSLNEACSLPGELLISFIIYHVNIPTMFFKITILMSMFWSERSLVQILVVGQAVWDNFRISNNRHFRD